MTPSYAQMCRVFGRIGLLSFGGPAVQIALMHKELVETRNWLDEQTYLRALSLCMLLPGPEAMQLATYAGWRLRGVPGGLIAGLLFVLPGAVVITALAGLYVRFGTLPLVQSAFDGIKAAVIVIVLQALLKVAKKSLSSAGSWAIATLAFVAIFAVNLPFPLIIAAAAIWGYSASPRSRDIPTTQPVRARPVRTATVWLALWLVPLLALSMANAGVLADIGWFFARLAVVTFGGAYAVLGYMTQTVVQEFNWVTTTQMIDALGLAETTPGPLILVTQFVAMLTGYAQGGATVAIVAGLVALWATFTPCFLWIFLAGPYLEALSARPALAAALQAITAAVVGVILNLSVWFALHVLFEQITVQQLGPLEMALPVLESADPVALCLTGVSLLLMIFWGLGMVRSLTIMAIIGLVAGLL